MSRAWRVPASLAGSRALPPDIDGLLAGASAALLVAGLGVADGGYFARSQAWAMLACVMLIAAAVALRAPPRMTALDLCVVAGLLGLALWNAASASIAGLGPSWAQSGRPLLYATAILAVVWLAGDESADAVLGGVLVGVVAVACAGLVPYLAALDGSRMDRVEGRLLYEPVGYANALGALAAIGALLAFGVAAHSASQGSRLGAAVVLVPLSSVLVLTSSRGAWTALVLGALTTAAVDRRPVARAAVWAVTGGVASIAVTALAVASGLDPTSRHALLPTLIALSAAVAAGTRSAGAPRRVTTRGRPRAGPWPATIAGVVVVASAAVVAVRGGLGDRPRYWQAALAQWQAHPWTGGGPGTFGRALLDSTGLGARDAHSLYVETLGELGIVGLALVIGSLTPPLVAGSSARSARLVPAALGAYVAFVVHAGIDWDWEMPVVALAGLLCGAGLLVASHAAAGAPIRPGHASSLRPSLSSSSVQRSPRSGATSEGS